MLIEMKRCFLHDKRVRNKFCAEAANTVVFLLSILPTKALENKTPLEASFRYKPFLSYQKIFFCLCFQIYLKLKEIFWIRRMNLEFFCRIQQSPKSILDQYISTNKIIIGKDVKFVKMTPTLGKMILNKKNI